MVKIKDLQQDKRRPARPPFISTGCGFDLDYLEYHLHLLFCNGTGWRAAGYAAAMVYPYDDHADNWRKRLSDAIKYYMLLKELTPLGLDRNIVLGSLGKLNLKKYREHVQSHVFPTDSPDSEIVVVDGHSKARPDVVTVRDSLSIPSDSGSQFPGFAPCINPNRKMRKRNRNMWATIKSPLQQVMMRTPCAEPGVEADREGPFHRKGWIQPRVAHGSRWRLFQDFGHVSNAQARAQQGGG